MQTNNPNKITKNTTRPAATEKTKHMFWNFMTVLFVVFKVGECLFLCLFFGDRDEFVGWRTGRILLVRSMKWRFGGVVATFCSTIFHLKFVTNVWAYHFCRGKDPETHGDIFLDIATKVFHHGSKKSTVWRWLKGIPPRTNLLQIGIIHHDTIIGVCPAWLYLHIFEEGLPCWRKKHKEIRNCYCIAAAETIIMIILQGTNISHALLKMIFLLPRWDMLIFRRVSIHFSYICSFFSWLPA